MILRFRGTTSFVICVLHPKWRSRRLGVATNMCLGAREFKTMGSTGLMILPKKRWDTISAVHDISWSSDNVMLRSSHFFYHPSQWPALPRVQNMPVKKNIFSSKRLCFCFFSRPFFLKQIFVIPQKNHVDNGGPFAVGFPNPVATAPPVTWLSGARHWSTLQLREFGEWRKCLGWDRHWLVGLGDDETTQLYRDYFINHEIRIPFLNNQYNEKYFWVRYFVVFCLPSPTW